MNILCASNKLSKQSASLMKPVAEDLEQDDRSSVSHHTGTSGESSASSFELGKSETLMLQYSKLLLLSLIAILATVVGFATYNIMREQERQDFENKFMAAAKEIEEFSRIRVHHIFESLWRLSTEISTDAVDAKVNWPFCEIHSFEVKGMMSNQDTESHTLSLAPIVYPEDVEDWTKFTVKHQKWIEDGHRTDAIVAEDIFKREFYSFSHDDPEGVLWNTTGAGITPFVWKYTNDDYGGDGQEHIRVHADTSRMMTPVWQTAPVPDYASLVNYDLHSNAKLGRFVEATLTTEEAIMTEVVSSDQLYTQYGHRFDPENMVEPHAYIFQPLYDSLIAEERKVVAILASFMPLGVFFRNIMASHEEGIVLVLKSSCNQSYTYEVFGKSAEYYGKGDLHALDTWSYDGLHQIKETDEEMAQHFHLPSSSNSDEDFIAKLGLCQYKVSLYPDFEFRDRFYTNKPYIYTVAVVSCFVLTTLVFAIYDNLVQRRQNVVMHQAKKTTAIVKSLFPENVRERLMDEVQNDTDKADNKNAFLNTRIKRGGAAAPFGDRMTSETLFGSKPIADLFPETTIMFADIVGFTAWSSIRDPTQAFSLLEMLYHAFDYVANKRHVFKVETIGDCYVAVAGLPLPRIDHAVVMAKFANDCRVEMKELFNTLDTLLGPDTSNLTMRFGLHSGQVTAGVLRGEKGRFQLFGDSMNTASRMESTSLPGKIQVSRQTAELLIAAGKEKWVIPREGLVMAKGKGQLQTYWLRVHADSDCNASHTANSSADSVEREALERKKALTLESYLRTQTNSSAPFGALSPKYQRIVEWNVDILVNLLKQIQARRASSGMVRHMRERELKSTLPNKNTTVLDEVQDILALPHFDAKTFHNHVDPDTIEIPKEIVNQLKDLVARIATLYCDNPFHNFEHASHVTMSITKLLSRIVSPIEVSTKERAAHEIAENLHDHTYGINSDPLTQFSCVLSGLIHDAAHPGVPNMTLVRECDPLAIKYGGKSVAEQNSVDLSWDIIMDPEYKELRACLYTNNDEYERFRSIVVNVVMATDIMDKDLGAQRKARWEKAFSEDETESDQHVLTNRKATIVLEHLMQASDVAHTMQHWTVYKKWNEKLFREMYKAYKGGRSEDDPSEGWYKSEIGFFDFYVIPLAKKLHMCGVFGVSSQEYLQYAIDNREEWAQKGQDIVKDYMKRLHEEEQRLQPEAPSQPQISVAKSA